MNHLVIIPKPVEKQLDHLPDPVYRALITKILNLQSNPRPRGCVKLRGYQNEYRIRVGDYRVRYQIRDAESQIVLLHCGHRKDVYRT